MPIDDFPPLKRTFSAYAVALLSVVLLLTGCMGFERLGEVAEVQSLVIQIIGSIPIAKPHSPITNVARLAMVVATLLFTNPLMLSVP